MTKFTTALILLLNLYCFAQENYYPYSFNVKPEDVKAEAFSKDSTANALIIYERGNSYVDNEDFELKTEIECKLKILNREGFDEATIVIPLYKNKDNSQKVFNIVASTHNIISGDKIEETTLSKKDIHNEEYNENYNLVKFTLPNIKEGSVITYSYKITSPFMFNYKGWNFQGDIPKLYSEYNTSVPANWQYHIKLIGGKKLMTNESKIAKHCLTTFNGGVADCTISKYAMKDIPAFIEEDYMTSKHNYLARIEYELKSFKNFTGAVNHYTKSWDDVDDELKKEKSVGRQILKSIDAKEFLPETIINETDILKKAKAIYFFVQENYTWDGKYSIYNDELSVKELIKNKSGNVSSINILLHNLLDASGIEVKPIIMSTRENGFATKEIPVISDFNYLTVQAIVDNNTYFLDATERYLTFGEIPFRCLNGYARLLDFKSGSSWIDINPIRTTYTMYNTELNFDDEKNLIGEVKRKSSGYHALYSKERYFPNKNSYVDELSNSLPNTEISDYNLISEDKTSDNFYETYNIQYKTEQIGDNIYLNPFFDKFTSENPFKLQERTYPVDFGYRTNYMYSFKINLGDKYTLLEKPQDTNLSLPSNSGQLIFTSELVDNSINLILKFNLKSPAYPPEFYPYLKEIFNKLVDIQQNSIFVLKSNS
ncbi:transglutaminase domain-containing protein [Aestuariibaculum lutulentum]|uniref:Transglutaminase-like domain-containing protein n=1 Tax=Aestuariibaculum lutulentum TaxID=2920935 RepID=A0ABS9RJ00_9FLAO|nr:transglutaminase domain-containing protein [Aestuariibaculum lutulentum]MCH4552930.1 hypothetical protein [Aestuariibaculum lutulentum]